MLQHLHNPDGPERCGVLLRSGEIVELENVHPTPYKAFAFHESALKNPEVIATWHTHPTTGPNLSIDDYKSFRAYPELGHFVIAQTQVWLFLMADGILVRYGNPTAWLSQRTASGTD